MPSLNVSESLMGIIGITTLFAFVLVAVPFFIYCRFKNEPFAFLDKSVPFDLGYGVRGMVTERKKLFESTYRRWNMIASCICIFSPIPFITSAFAENDMLSAIMLAVTMVIAGLGAAVFITVGVQKASMDKLLGEGDYTLAEKQKSGLSEAVGSVYWGIVTTIFFVWSFLFGDWHISWITFAVGGMLFPAVLSICNAISNKKK